MPTNQTNKFNIMSRCQSGRQPHLCRQQEHSGDWPPEGDVLHQFTTSAKTSLYKGQCFKSQICWPTHVTTGHWTQIQLCPCHTEHQATHQCLRAAKLSRCVKLFTEFYWEIIITWDFPGLPYRQLGSQRPSTNPKASVHYSKSGLPNLQKEFHLEAEFSNNCLRACLYQRHSQNKWVVA